MSPDDPGDPRARQAPGQCPALLGLALAVAAVACAIQVSGWLPPPPLRRALWVATLPLAAGWWAWRNDPHVRRLRRRCCGVALAAALACNLLVPSIEDALAGRLDASLEDLPLELDVVVDELPDRRAFGDRVTAAVRACRVLGAPPGSAGCANLRRVQLSWSPARQRDREDPARRDAWPEPGDHWRVRMRARRPAAPVNPGGFDAELRLLQQGIGATGRVSARRRIDATTRTLASRIDVGFEALRARLRTALEAQAALHRAPGERRWREIAILGALALGDQKAIDADAWGLFARTGVSHLMAISGMHVTMLALAASSLVGWAMRVRVRRGASGLVRLTRGVPRQRITLVLAVVLAFFYARLSGWGIPSQRTCWMLGAAALLTLSLRRGGALSITAVATLPVLLTSPWAVGAAGFWLSFVAVAALVWQGQGARGGARRPWWRELLAAQWASSIGLLPLTVALFSMASLVGPPVNLLAIPWVSLLITPFALLLVATAPLAATLPMLDWPWQRLLDLAGGAVGALLNVLQWVDRLPGASVTLAEPGWAVTLLAVAAAALLLAPAGPGLRMLAVPALLPLAIGARDLPSAGGLRITALDIGQGSAILVETADAAVLYDTGGGQAADRSVAKRVLLPWFGRRGRGGVDLIVVSHLDAEHAGGAAVLVDALRPRWLASPFDARMLTADGLPSGTEAQRCVQGWTLSVGTMHVAALGPPQAPLGRKAAADNAASCVLRISAAGGSVLLAGDLPARAERALIAANAPGAFEATVLVVPAQGSRLAAGAPLVDAVKPAIALVQLPRRNRHGHPHASVLERLAEADTTVLRTDRDGALRVELHPDAAPSITRTRRDAAPYWRIVE
ncbi:MAG: DNA internalization-related competence protein ComEC/Rec2 [Lautropia sp.]